MPAWILFVLADHGEHGPAWDPLPHLTSVGLAPNNQANTLRTTTVQRESRTWVSPNAESQRRVHRAEAQRQVVQCSHVVRGDRMDTTKPQLYFDGRTRRARVLRVQVRREI